LEPRPGRRGIELLDGHDLRALQEFRHLLAFAQPDVGFLPVRPVAGVAALPLFLAVRDAGADRLDLAAEQLLDRVLDLRLVRVHVHLEHERAAVFTQNRRLLGDERAADHVGEFHASTSCSFSSALRVAMTLPAFMTLRAFTRPLATNSTPAMLRTDFASFSSSATSIRTALPSTPSRFSISEAAFVFTSPADSDSTTTSAPSFIFWASAARRAPRSTFFGSAKS